MGQFQLRSSQKKQFRGRMVKVFCFVLVLAFADLATSQAPKCCVENSDLVSAAIEGNLEKVKNMLRFVDPNSAEIAATKKKTYALHEAASRGYINILKVLIAAGADVDLQTQQSDGDLWDTALHLAVFHGHLSAVKILVASGASLTTGKQQDGRAVEPMDGQLAVHVALGSVVSDKTNQTKWQIFKHLVRNGAPLDFNLYGKSARALSRSLGWVIPHQYYCYYCY